MADLSSIPARTPNFEKWQPDETDKPRIVAELLDYYECTLETCGANDEQTTEAYALYFKVQNHTLTECKDDVQEFFMSCFEAVGGEIEKYYDADSSLTELICLTICPE